MSQIAVSGAPGQEAEVAALAAALGLPRQNDAPLLLYRTDERLELRETGAKAAGPVYADFVVGRADYRRKQAGRGQPLARAVGLKGDRLPSIIDATAGLGRDAFVLASLGAEVTLLERSPIVGALLADALRRARAHPEVAPIAARMSLHIGDAREYLQSLATHPDVIYLDPMYPHSSKNALPKKEMRLFRQFIGGDEDAAALLEVARKTAQKRVVVKRPVGAAPLGGKPDSSIPGKTTRFDLYLSRTR